MKYRVIDEEKLKEIEKNTYQAKLHLIEDFLNDILDKTNLSDFLLAGEEIIENTLLKWSNGFYTLLWSFQNSCDCKALLDFLNGSDIKHLLKKSASFSEKSIKKILMNFDYPIGQLLRYSVNYEYSLETRFFFHFDIDYQSPKYLTLVDNYLPIFEELDRKAKTRQYFIPPTKKQVEDIFEEYFTFSHHVKRTFDISFRKIVINNGDKNTLSVQDEFALYFISSLSALNPLSPFSQANATINDDDESIQASVLENIIKKYDKNSIKEQYEDYKVPYNDRMVPIQSLILKEENSLFSNMLIRNDDFGTPIDFFEYAKRRLFMYYVIKNEFAKAGNVLKQTDVYKSFNISPDFLMNQINSEIGLYHNDLYLPESIFTIINLDKERFRGYTKKIIPSFDELTRFLVSMAEFFMITNSNEEFKKIYSLLITNFPVYKEIEALKAKHIYLSIYSQFGKKISELNSIEELEKIDTLIKQMPIFERNVYLERITDEYKINLSNIDSMTIECIITGDYVFDTLKRNEHKMDYASAAICWCRAAEKEIKDKLITPLLVSNDTKTKEIIAKAKLPKAVTLGTLSQITGISHDKQVEIDRAKYIFECVISKDFLFNSEAFIKLCVYIDTLRHNFRNVVSHPEEITLVRAEECRKIILGINKILHIISNNYIPEKNLQA